MHAFGIGSSPECRVTDFGALVTLAHIQYFPRSDLEVLSKTGETISSAVETNIHIPSRHLVCGLEVLLCVSVFLGKSGPCRGRGFTGYLL